MGCNTALNNFGARRTPERFRIISVSADMCGTSATTLWSF